MWKWKTLQPYPHPASVTTTMWSAIGEINYSKTSIHSPNDVPWLEITMPDTCAVQLL